MDDDNYKRLKLIKTILVISIGLFLFSLTQECFCTDADCADSISALLAGWLTIFFSASGITWLANPLLFVGWILTKKDSKYAIACSFFSTALSVSFLFFRTIIDNEAGNASRINEYKLGYWLWTLSSVTMFIGNIILEKKLYNQKPPST